MVERADKLKNAWPCGARLVIQCLWCSALNCCGRQNFFASRICRFCRLITEGVRAAKAQKLRTHYTCNHRHICAVPRTQTVFWGEGLGVGVEGGGICPLYVSPVSYAYGSGCAFSVPRKPSYSLFSPVH